MTASLFSETNAPSKYFSAYNALSSPYEALFVPSFPSNPCELSSSHPVPPLNSLPVPSNTPIRASGSGYTELSPRSNSSGVAMETAQAPPLTLCLLLLADWKLRVGGREAWLLIGLEHERWKLFLLQFNFEGCLYVLDTSPLSDM